MLNIFSRLVLLSSCLLATACETTQAQLRSDPSETGSFEVKMPYKAVLDNFTACANFMATGRVAPVPLNTSYFYPVIKENNDENLASVDIVQASTFIFPKRVLISTDIVADGNNTKVTYYKHPMYAIFRDIRPELEAWANGTEACKQKEEEK